MTDDVLDCGYIPLVDSAPLIIAKELNFASEEGLHLNLLRQPSWAATRDMLMAGHLDAAHMLAPWPIALALGLGGPAPRIDTLMNISSNGNIVCVSRQVAARMRRAGWQGGVATPAATGAALLDGLERPLRVAVPFPYSMHRLLLDYWLRSFGANIAFETITLPPPRMAQALAEGQIDAFCAGEPWGSVAVQQGVGQIVQTGASIWSSAPEKVLATRHDWAESQPEKCAALMRAVYRACEWLDAPTNKVLAIEILARSEHLALSAQVIEPALLEHMTPAEGAEPVPVPGFLRFHQNATTFPWKSQAAWMAGRLGNPDQKTLDAAKARHRTDLYRACLGPIGADLPGASEKLEGALLHATAVASTKGQMILGPDAFFDGAIFDPSGVA